MLGSQRSNKVGVSPGTTTLVLGNTVECPNPSATAFQVASLGPPQDFDWMRPPPEWRQKWWPARVTAPAPNVAQKVAMTPAPAADPAARRVVAALSPYATFESLRGATPTLFQRLIGAIRRTTNLGLVLAPYGDISPNMYSEISATMQNIHQQCGPFDPQYNQNGDAGYYYDTPLGASTSAWRRFKDRMKARGMLGNVSPPSDLQLSRIYGYTPQMSSYVPFKNQTWTIAPWTPPNGGSGSMYPVLGPPLRGARKRRWRMFGDDAPADTATDTFTESTTPIMVPVNAGLPPIATTATVLSPAEQAVQELKRHQDRLFTLSIMSTGAIVGGFLLNVLKERRERNMNSKKNKPHYEGSSITAPISGARRRR